MWKNAVDHLVYNVWKFKAGSHLSETVNFFIYDSVKIFFLLVVIIFAVSLIRTFFPVERVKKFIGGKRSLTANILAALLGVITPFCSCSAVPLFIGFIEAGIPLGATFSFLVASPMINEVALVLLFGMFGIKIAAAYLISGLIIAILSGIIIGKLKLEKWVEDYVYKIKAGGIEEKQFKLKDRLKYSADYVADILKNVWYYVIIAVAIGGFIHGYVPQDFLVKYAGKNAWYGVPLATLIGVPLYSNAAGVIPIVNALFQKGMALGTVLAFMMAVTGLSFPEMVLLRRVLKPKLLAVFIGIVSAGIIITGYIFNAIG